MGVHAVERTDVDERPAPLRLHVGEGLLHRPEGGEESHVPAVVHPLGRRPFEARRLATAPCVVDDDVDLSPLLHRSSDASTGLGLVLDVGVHEVPLTTQLIDLGRDPRTGLVVPLCDHDTTALARESTGDSAPDALSGPGDNRDPSIQSSSHGRTIDRSGPSMSLS